MNRRDKQPDDLGPLRWPAFVAWALLLVLIIAFVIVASGCQSMQDGTFHLLNPSTWIAQSGGGGGGQSSDPTQVSPGAAQSTLWPFTALGALTMMAGIVERLLTGSGKLLTIGIGLALVPLGVTWALQQFAPALKWIIIPISIAIGLAGVTWIGLRVWQEIKARKCGETLKQQIKRKKVAT